MPSFLGETASKALMSSFYALATPNPRSIFSPTGPIPPPPHTASRSRPTHRSSTLVASHLRLGDAVRVGRPPHRRSRGGRTPQPCKTMHISRTSCAPRLADGWRSAQNIRPRTERERRNAWREVSAASIRCGGDAQLGMVQRTSRGGVVQPWRSSTLGARFSLHDVYLVGQRARSQRYLPGIAPSRDAPVAPRSWVWGICWRRLASVGHKPVRERGMCCSDIEMCQK